MKKRNFIGHQVGKRHPIHFLPKMDWSKPVKAQIYSQ
jgi:hypothetical protein